TVFPGVVIAHLLGRSLLLGALTFGVLTAVLLTTVGGHRRVGDDAALAILLTSFFSLGVVLISRTRGFTADLTVFLFGRVLAVDRTGPLHTLRVPRAPPRLPRAPGGRRPRPPRPRPPPQGGGRGGFRPRGGGRHGLPHPGPRP